MMLRRYSAQGTLIGSSSEEERRKFIEREVQKYDLRHPGNGLTVREKKKRARHYWSRKVRRTLAYEKRQFDSIAPKKTTRIAVLEAGRIEEVTAMPHEQRCGTSNPVQSRACDCYRGRRLKELTGTA